MRRQDRNPGILDEMSGYFPAVFVATKPVKFGEHFLPRLLHHICTLLKRLQDISSCVCGNKLSYLGSDIRTLTAVFVAKNPGIFDEMSYFPAVFVATKPDEFEEQLEHFLPCLWRHIRTFYKRLQDISSCLSGNKTRYLEPKDDLFLILAKLILWLNPTRL